VNEGGKADHYEWRHRPNNSLDRSGGRMADSYQLITIGVRAGFLNPVRPGETLRASSLTHSSSSHSPGLFGMCAR
jgi:acyl dehydratase